MVEGWERNFPRRIKETQGESLNFLATSHLRSFFFAKHTHFLMFGVSHARKVDEKVIAIRRSLQVKKPEGIHSRFGLLKYFVC
jgi:hypothetical protein